MLPRVGERLGGYRLDAVLGRGGGGVVYRATHVRLDAPVAVKVLQAELAGDPAFRRRFDNEARVAASLVHPHIVPVYDAGEIDGLLYLVMRLVEGCDLGSLVAEQGPLPPARACALLEQVASALTMMHIRGLVHRDVKPGNVLVSPPSVPDLPEQALVSDFGLVRAPQGTNLTGELVIGTLAYMSPERFAARVPPDPAMDLYALGCMAYACLTGSPPFGNDSPESLIAAHLYAAPPRLATSDGRIPAAVDEVLARALAKDPRQRQPSCAAFVAELRAAFAGAPVRGSTGVLPTPSPDGTGAADRRRRNRRLLRYGLAAGAALLTAVVVAATVWLGTPSATFLDRIGAIAISRNGDLYITTLGDDRVQVVRHGGGTSTIAGGNGEGFAGDGGPATDAMLAEPQGIAVAADGSVFIADTDNNRIRRIAPDGTISTVAGTGSRGALGDGGQAVLAELNSPVDLAIDSSGTLLVADNDNLRVRAIDPQGVIRTVAGTGDSGDDGDGGPATAASLASVFAVAADPAGGFYVVDNASSVVRRVAADGTISRVAGGGTDTGDGRGALDTALGPTAAAVGPDGILYITESGNDRVRRLESGPTGAVLRTVLGAGTPGYSADGARAEVSPTARPLAIAVGPDGIVYVAEVENGRIRTVAGGVLGTAAGGGPTFPRDGEAAGSFLRGPNDLAVDAQGRVYVADYGTHRIRRIDPDGRISTIAGTGVRGFGGDGGPATDAVLNRPISVAVTPDGSVLVMDYFNDRLRRITPDGTITTVGGTGLNRDAVDGLPLSACPLGGVEDVTVGPDGSLYLAEPRRNKVHKVGPDGIVRLLAGTGVAGTSGDGGPATAATLNMPDNLFVQADGSVVVASIGDGTVRRVDPNGVITTVAGTGTPGNSGDDGPATQAQLDQPYGVTGSADGTLYIGDGDSRVIRRIDPGGTISTFAGDGRAGVTTPEGPATATGVGSPNGMVLLPDGALLAADYPNDRILRVADGTVTTVAGRRTS